ncbi:MAG TPA: hypothetical protein VKZ63_16315 [Kofleriaceae bacterium]|nr:hypothetical protein [Kofleriaceae bacterium]
MRRRPLVQYSSLTSLLDVMFILVFASLIHGASLEARERERAAAEAEAREERRQAELDRLRREADAGPPEPATAEPAAPEAPPDGRALHRAALSELVASFERREPVIARVTEDGRLRQIESAGETIPLALPLVERDPDPDVALRYLGDRSEDLRLCNLVRLQLGTDDLSRHLVIVAPDAPLERLSVALARGLRRDADRCAPDLAGVAVLVDPADAAGSKGGTP